MAKDASGRAGSRWSAPSLVRKAVLLVACAKAVEYAVRAYTREHNVEHEGDQVAVFFVVLVAFATPVLSPVLQLKLLILGDLAPWAETALVDAAGRWLFTPAGKFEDYEVGPPTDYGLQKHWSMMPNRGDTSEAVPEGCVTCEQAGVCGAADVFYLHPTTWYTGASWNAPAIHPVTAYLSDDAIGPQQANAFNVVGRVFAPRYRQMSAGAFLQEGGFSHPDAAKALATAYEDVRAAFTFFLREHWDGQRGIIVAGHSQGSVLGEMLVQEFFSEGPLRESLVAAYLPGWTLFESRYTAKDGDGGKGIPVCKKEHDTGCLISWRTFGVGGDPAAFLHVPPADPSDRPVCVNPLTWAADSEYAGRELNMGGLDLMHPWTMWNYLRGVTRSADRVQLPALTANVSDAQCVDGHLFVTPPSRFGQGWALWPAWLFASFPGLNLHPYDYNLFFNNIRQNVATRARAFASRAGKESVRRSDGARVDADPGSG